MCWILYVNCMCNVLIFRDIYTIRSTHLIPIMFYFVTPFECRPFVFIILLESSNATHTHTHTDTPRCNFSQQQQQQQHRATSHTQNDTIEAMSIPWNASKKVFHEKRTSFTHTTIEHWRHLFLAQLHSLALSLFSTSHHNTIMISQMLLFLRAP